MLNSWSGGTAGEDGTTFWVFRVAVDGPVDSSTGFLCDIKALDALVRNVLVPDLRGRLSAGSYGEASAGNALCDAFPTAAKQCPTPAVLAEIELAVTPFLRLTVSRGDPGMVKVTRSYEFAAAHRLYRPDWNDEKNRQVFGKCSNPLGHGHNYVLDVTLSGAPDEALGTIADASHVDRVVAERVIHALDHRNLNVECPEFATLNPTVENIARVIWSRLEGAFTHGTLTAVRVWETPKTYAEFTGP